MPLIIVAKMKVLALIPARMASTRFPGKPLQPLCGLPMLHHIFRNVNSSVLVTDVAVATCDEEIRSSMCAVGCKVIMTSSEHQRASDRCAEALEVIEMETGISYDIVVMLQGDEPMVTGDMVDMAVSPLIEDQKINVVNLCSPITSEEDAVDPNCVKVVFSANRDALYFSRSPIPSPAHGFADGFGYKQVCVIPFRKEYLIKYQGMVPTCLEIAESVDMLRILEHGDSVKMVITNSVTYPVDTPQDLERVERLISSSQVRVD